MLPSDAVQDNSTHAAPTRRGAASRPPPAEPRLTNARLNALVDDDLGAAGVALDVLDVALDVEDRHALGRVDRVPASTPLGSAWLVLSAL